MPRSISFRSSATYCFSCIGCPQHDSWPFALPLVTIISLLQTAHKYRLPTTFAMGPILMPGVFSLDSQKLESQRHHNGFHRLPHSVGAASVAVAVLRLVPPRSFFSRAKPLRTRLTTGRRQHSAEIPRGCQPPWENQSLGELGGQNVAERATRFSAAAPPEWGGGSSMISVPS